MKSVQSRRARARTWPSLAILFALASAAPFRPALGAAPSAADIEFFEREVRPLLAEQCFACHSDRVDTPFAGLRLDSREAALAGGDSGIAILPGNPEQSRLIQMLRGAPVIMPPTGKLPDDRIDAIAEWIRMGAPWPDSPASDASTTGGFDLEARRNDHWAWQPVKVSDLPEVGDGDWPANPVDNFVLARLAQEGLQPAAAADRRTLIRRLTFDITGLPPSPGEIAAFVSDERPDAYAELVRRLLASERFGERWARHWMDWVRYADSHGSEGDPSTPNAWRYRDYLVRGLNADTPYDQLVREHLAGDLLERPRLSADGEINESILGTAHLRLVELGYQPVDPWEERVKWTDNQIDVVSKAFQGLTVSCARCHDHKFDAISQRDYYALFGTLYGARPTMRAADSPAALSLHVDELQDLKRRIRDAVAADWIAATAALGDRLVAVSDDAVRDALEEAACDFESPLHAFLELSGRTDSEFEESWQELRSGWHREIESRKTFNAARFERIWDLSGDDYELWVNHGTGASESPSAPGEFAVLHEGDAALRGIYPGGVYTHLLSTKHAGVMQSPRFEIDTNYVSVKVLGGDVSFARLIVENYPLPGGGIYHQRYSPRSDEMRWWRWDTRYWKGFTAYVEFTTREDSTNFVHDPIDAAKKPRPERPQHGRSAIGAAAVAIHNDKVQPRETSLPILYLLDGDRPGSEADVPALIARRLVVAIEAWQEGRLDELQASYLDYFVRRGLLPTTLATLERASPLVAEYRRLEAEIPVPQRFPGVLEEGSADQPLLLRGDPRKPGSPVPRKYLSAIGGDRYSNPGTVRLAMAEDVASPTNPLTARVMANRVWQYVFGRGIVATPDNFGVLGERPSHPELLDYLAGHFVESGWSIKGLIELLVSSRTYRMGSDASAQALQTDPANVLLQHMPVRRLEAEAIRDALLAVSGQLDTTMYGGLQQGRDMYSAEKGLDTGTYGTNRRSVYQEIRRNRTNPFLEVFDRPIPSTTRGRRDVTNVPAQSLALMNSAFVIAAAEAWGRHLAAGEGRSAETRVDYMYVKALGRPPRPAERTDAIAFVNGLAEEEGVLPHGLLSDAKVWGRMAHALFNFKEFLYVR